LIRNVMGIHQESEGLVIGEMLREGQVVQFHVRDAEAAAEDLETLLGQYVADRQGTVGSGALLFSCLGRGKHLFGRPDHDTGIFQARVGDVPLGGFFCNGEIGPVSGSTFLHGFTSSFGIFSPKGS
ncbi:MAG: FIST C-terminal domain-containing protein, partial [Dehalococcoidia bacterium]